jgi:hypothetical protein
MDKYLIKNNTFTQLEDSVLEKVNIPFTLGVIGNSSSTHWSQSTIWDEVLDPIISEQNQNPKSVIFSSDGNTSLLLEVISNRKKLNPVVYTVDWKKLGRRARAICDSRIVNDSSHLLFFLGSRSDYYEKMAIREAKKGKIVYTIDPITFELVQWEL